MKRDALTLAPRFAGADHRVFVGLALDGARVIGVHVETGTEGLAIHEHARTAAALADLALRYGAPVAEVAELLRETRGEHPAPRAVEDVEGVAEAWGILDLVGQILEVQR